MADIQIITDAGADLTKEQQKEYNIDVLPLKIYADGKEYLAGVNTFSDDFYALLENLSDFPKTSQPTTAEFYDLFKKYTDNGKQVLMLSLSSNASGLFNNANLAKNMILEENENAVIEIVDTQRYSYIYGLAAIKASQMAQMGKEIPEIIDSIKEFLESYAVYCIPKTLDYLEKGGRINKASLIFGNMLDIVPVLSIVDGLMEAVGKVRGRKKIAKKLVNYALERHPEQSNTTFLIANGKMDEEVAEIVSLLKEKYPDSKIIEYKVGPLIASHIGPVCGIFLKK